MKRKAKLTQLWKELLKMPVSQRRAIVLRAKFELIRGGRSATEPTVNVTATLRRAGLRILNGKQT